MISSDLIKFVQGRYEYLHLTRKQADLICQFEQEITHYSLSVWEQWDLELATFREILKHDQYITYEAMVKDSVAAYEQNLKKEDEEESKELAYWEEVVDYYENQFLPAIFSAQTISLFKSFPNERPKLDYLQAEYRRYLRNTKNTIVSDHFRHNRAFKPNALKVRLMMHRLDHIKPNYFTFKAYMDEPTRAVVQNLTTKFRVPPEMEQKVNMLLNKARNFVKKLDHKYKRNLGGWHVTVTISEEEQKEGLLMTMLLLDKNKYE